MTELVSRGLRTISILICLGCCVWPSNLWANDVAHEDGQTKIEDVEATKHFLSAKDIYTDGATFLLCVEEEPQKFAFWNPVSEEITQRFDGKNCVPDPQFRAMRALVSPPGGTVMTDTGMGGAEKISLIFDHITRRCSPPFRTFYKVEYGDGSSKTFYIVVRLAKTETFVLDSTCDAANGTQQSIDMQFDTVGSLVSVDLKNGQTLLYSYDGRAKQPLIIKLSSLPDETWSSQKELFLIPGKAFHSQLDRVDFSLSKMYDVLLAFTSKGP